MKNADLKELYQKVAYQRFDGNLPEEKKAYLDGCLSMDFEGLNKNTVESIHVQFGHDGVQDLLKQIALFPNLKQLFLNDCCHCPPGFGLVSIFFASCARFSAPSLISFSPPSLISMRP